MHPGQEGTILYQLSIYNQTLQKMIEDEETPSAETGMDVSMQVLDEEEDEEQAVLASMSQKHAKTEQQ